MKIIPSPPRGGELAIIRGKTIVEKRLYSFSGSSGICVPLAN
jgi:hypothetical protein